MRGPLKVLQERLFSSVQFKITMVDFLLRCRKRLEHVVGLAEESSNLSGK